MATTAATGAATNPKLAATLRDVHGPRWARRLRGVAEPHGAPRAVPGESGKRGVSAVPRRVFTKTALVTPAGSCSDVSHFVRVKDLTEESPRNEDTQHHKDSFDYPPLTIYSQQENSMRPLCHRPASSSMAGQRNLCDHLGTRVTPLLLAAVLISAAGCSSSSTNNAGSGGNAGVGQSGGSPSGKGGGAGGTTQASGGATGTTPTGGTSLATGGKSAAGGASGTAGATSSGGAAGGSAGAAGGSNGGAGGSSGRGGASGGATGTGGSGGTTGKGGASGGAAGTGMGGTTLIGGSGGSGAGGITGVGGAIVVGPADIYVSTTGDDGNPGTQDKPLKTIAAAQTAARAHAKRGKEPLVIGFLPGTYYVGKTVVFTTADSGAKDAPVTYTGYGGAATLSGGVSLSLTWSAYKNNIMQATVPSSVSTGMSFDVLFLNGQRQIMARYPNYDPSKLTTAFQGIAGDYQSRPSKWAKPPTGEVYAHCMHTSDWGSQHYVMTGVSGSLNLSKALCNGRASGANGSGVVENVLDELDAPGEWYFDKSAGTLYFYPPQGTDLSTALIEVAGLETIIQFQGTSTAPVKFVNLDGFRYNATSRTFAKCNEQVLKSDWVIYRGGGLFLSGVEDSAITNSFFDALGGNALFVSGYARRMNIQTNKFVGIGASAILLMGVSSAVRNPGSGYSGGFVVSSLDKTAGPKTDDYPAQCTVTDNLIHDIGYPQKQVAGIGLDMASEITISHNSIYNMPRAGINIGDGCWGGHIIEYNDVFDTVLETGDHGSFNSWGRDRYWDPNVGTIDSRVAASPGLEVLDAMKPVITSSCSLAARVSLLSMTSIACTTQPQPGRRWRWAFTETSRTRPSQSHDEDHTANRFASRQRSTPIDQ